MNAQERIEKAIYEFNARPCRNSASDVSAGCRPAFGTNAYHAALAEHLAAVLPVTFDAVMGAVTYYGDRENVDVYLRCHEGGSGSIRFDDTTLISWPPSKTPGKTIIEAIKAATTPEPTAAERFNRLTKAMDKRTMMVTLSEEELEDIMAIRKALDPNLGVRHGQRTD